MRPVDIREVAVDIYWGNEHHFEVKNYKSNEWWAGLLTYINYLKLFFFLLKGKKVGKIK